MNDEQPNNATQSVSVSIWQDGVLDKKPRLIAIEKPVALSYNGTSHAVMMATPIHLEDFALGFSLTEGLISSRQDVEDIVIVEFEQGFDIQIKLNQIHNEAFQKRRRHMAGPVGCGLCGIESIDSVMRDLPKIVSTEQFPVTSIMKAVHALKAKQAFNQLTYSMHGAGFYKPEIGMLVVREDVGRHNALDKLCGAMLNTGETLAGGAVIVTSRLSVEMVQKTALMGASILIAISAPTAEAVRIACEANLTLVARARDHKFEIYSGIERILF